MVRKLNELYKASVTSCQGLSLRLQRFFLDKQRLLDGIHGVTAERLILSHAVQMVCPWVGPVAPKQGRLSFPSLWAQRQVIRSSRLQCRQRSRRPASCSPVPTTAWALPAAAVHAALSPTVMLRASSVPLPVGHASCS